MTVEAGVLDELRLDEQVGVGEGGVLVVGDLARRAALDREDPQVARPRRPGVGVDDVLAVGVPQVAAAGLAGRA